MLYSRKSIHQGKQEKHYLVCVTKIDLLGNKMYCIIFYGCAVDLAA